MVLLCCCLATAVAAAATLLSCYGCCDATSATAAATLLLLCCHATAVLLRLLLHDLTPIEIAAREDNLAIVDTLFDFTAPIPHISTWDDFHGIYDYINSQEAKDQ
ncbi:hypothetical protein SOVF_178700, partial [Spinacia oleracea]